MKNTPAAKLFWLKVILFPGCLILSSLLAGCALEHSHPTILPASPALPAETALTADEIATLSSLEQLDDYPLYSLHYVGAYPYPNLSSTLPPLPLTVNTSQPAWGCALFAALGDPASRLYGRNFDWRFSPALLLFTDPPDGYASVSMVDMEYLGFTGDLALNLLDLPLSERQPLLEAPSLPFDGMNEQGLAVGMAAVPSGEMVPDPSKETIGELGVIRQVLDHAATVDEALQIFAHYNIDMSEVPLHYLVATSAGESALVEFYQGEMFVFRNIEAWQLATNFLVAATAGQLQGQCPRYDRLSRGLQSAAGRLSPPAALTLLEGVSQGGPQTQSSTQWSIVYDLTGGEMHVVMGREFDADAHTLQLTRLDP